MINASKINSEMKIPGIYAVIEESKASAIQGAVEVGKTPTAILDAPDFIYVADAEFGGATAVKPVMIENNTVYVIDDPLEFLKTLRGEIFAEGSLTKEQLDAMRAPYLENALEIAAEKNKKFAFVKMVKRDGTRPDMSNLFEIYQAYEVTKESLSVVNVGTVIPFGVSIQDVFELADSEATASLVFSKGTNASGDVFEGYASTVFPNKYSLDIEKTVTGNLSFEIVDYGAVTTGDIATNVEANVYYKDAGGVKTVIKEGLAVDYKGGFKFSNTYDSVDAITLRENTLIEVIPGEIEVVLNSGTLMATVAKEADGTLVRDGSNVLVLNYDLSVAVPDAATAIGENQNVEFVATVNKNPYVEITPIVEPAYDHKIQIMQGYDDETGVKNFDPERSESFVLTFELNGAKDKVDINVGLGAMKTKIDAAAVTGTAGVYKLAEAVELTVSKGVKALLPLDLLVYNETATVDASLADSIYYNLTYEVKNQPSYMINVVPFQARFADLWAEFAHNNTFELDETRVILSSGLIGSNSNTDKEAFVKKLEEIALRGSMKLQLSASNVQDLGKYISIPVGSLKSLRGVGGFKPDTSYRVQDFGRTNGGAGEVEAQTNIVILAKGEKIRKGDSVEITTIKRFAKVAERNTVEDVSVMLDGRYKVLLKDKVDTAKFNLAAYEVTLSLINKKDLKGNYMAFQYAIFSEEFDSKAPVREVIPGTAECTFGKEHIKRLDTAGYSVINYDPTADSAFIENTPTLATAGSQFDDQIDVGTAFWLIKECRSVGRDFQGVNMNKPENQSSYSDRIKRVKDDALGKTLVTSVSIVPNFAQVAKGKITAKLAFTTAETLRDIVYYTQINKEA